MHLENKIDGTIGTYDNNIKKSIWLTTKWNFEVNALTTIDMYYSHTLNCRSFGSPDKIKFQIELNR